MKSAKTMRGNSVFCACCNTWTPCEGGRSQGKPLACRCNSAQMGRFPLSNKMQSDPSSATHTNTHVCHGNSGHTNTLRSSRCSCLAYLQVQQRALRREATPASASFFFLFFCAAGSKNNTAQKTNNKINAQTDSHLSSLSNRPPFLLLLLPLLLPPLKVSDGLKPGNTHTEL